MKPLEGIKVVELSTMLAGPMCARVLAEWGADVIKVETLNGDAWRKQAGTTLSPCTPDANPNFDMQNLNKRFVSLNLRTEGGQEAMMKLLEGADGPGGGGHRAAGPPGLCGRGYGVHAGQRDDEVMPGPCPSVDRALT